MGVWQTRMVGRSRLLRSNMHTTLCDLLAIEHPIIQAPIGSATSPELVAAVSNAGALGMLSVTWREPHQIRRLIREIHELTDKPFAVNLVLQWDMWDRLEVCLNEGVQIFSFFWGDPTRYTKVIHERDGLVLHSVGGVEEAQDAVAAGVDVIVAQGWEAGGHVRGQISTMALVPRVFDAVTPIPVVAAGGIGDGRGIAAALALGASGVWLGTRFLASEEANIHPLYQNAVLRASEDDTLYATNLFEEGWPEAPHRVLRNTTTRLWDVAGSPQSERPSEGEVVAHYADGRPIKRYSDVIPLPGMTGDVESLAMYAGQSVGLVEEVLPAAEIVQRLVSETEAALARLNRSIA